MNDRAEPGVEETTGVGDLPYVDGRAATSDELRAEIAKETDPRVQRIEELRTDVAATLDELGSRLDPRPQISRRVSQARPVLIAVASLLVVVALWRRLSARRLSRN
jgi:hypothetical protein